jgi:hypothetical protein
MKRIISDFKKVFQWKSYIVWVQLSYVTLGLILYFFKSAYIFPSNLGQYVIDSNRELFNALSYTPLIIPVLILLVIIPLIPMLVVIFMNKYFIRTYHL